MGKPDPIPNYDESIERQYHPENFEPIMKDFMCIIKNHSGDGYAPDFEYEIQAEDKEEAVDKVVAYCHKYGHDVDRDLIYRNTEEV